jgi:hypothetical protein
MDAAEGRTARAVDDGAVKGDTGPTFEATEKAWRRS